MGQSVKLAQRDDARPHQNTIEKLFDRVDPEAIN